MQRITVYLVYRNHHRSFTGRVSRRSTKTIHDSGAKAQSKLDRRNRAKQIQLRKRQSLLSAVSIFGGVDGAPRIVAVVPLCEDVDSRSVVSALCTCLGVPDDTEQESVWKIKFVGPTFPSCLRSSSRVHKV